MYSLNCDYFEAEFKTIGDLIAHIAVSGMDPNYEITRNGKGTGETAADVIIILQNYQDPNLKMLKFNKLKNKRYGKSRKSVPS